MVKCENGYNKDILQRNNGAAKKIAVQNMLCSLGRGCLLEGGRLLEVGID